MLTILLVSCDVQTNILVANNTNSTTVKISYNREFYSYVFEKQKNKDFLRPLQSSNRHLKLLKCDTLNKELSFTFKLLKNDTLYVDKSRGSNPNYSSIDSITIIKEDAKKVTLQSNNYDDNFKNYDNIFIYNIK